MVYLQIHQAVVRIPTADWPTQHRPMFPIPAVEQWRRAVRPAGCCRQRKCPKGQQSQRFPIHKDTQQLKIVNYTYFNITNAIIHIYMIDANCVYLNHRFHEGTYLQHFYWIFFFEHFNGLYDSFASNARSLLRLALYMLRFYTKQKNHIWKINSENLNRRNTEESMTLTMQYEFIYYLFRCGHFVA